MDTEFRMQASAYNTSSPRQHHSSPISRKPRLKHLRSSTASRGDPTSSDLDTASLLTKKMANDKLDLTNGASRPPISELHKIRRNSLYLTFNAPQVDEYHRALFLTHPPTDTDDTASFDESNKFSGTLFHASYTSSTLWQLETRPVKNVSQSQSLVLLYRLCTLSASSTSTIEQQFTLIRSIIEKVPIGKEAREREIGPCQGHPDLGGYDCVIWTSDAVKALVDAGIVCLGGRPVDDVIAEARALAGPEDAKTAVGVDFGGTRVIN